MAKKTVKKTTTKKRKIKTVVPKKKEKQKKVIKTPGVKVKEQFGSKESLLKEVKKLFDKLGTRFGQRAGGYTRIVRLGWRHGDGAEQALLELVGAQLVKRAAERAKRKEERMKAVREGREEEPPPA